MSVFLGCPRLRLTATIMNSDVDNFEKHFPTPPNFYNGWDDDIEQDESQDDKKHEKTGGEDAIEEVKNNSKEDNTGGEDGIEEVSTEDELPEFTDDGRRIEKFWKWGKEPTGRKQETVGESGLEKVAVPKPEPKPEEQPEEHKRMSANQSNMTIEKVVEGATGRDSGKEGKLPCESDRITSPGGGEINSTNNTKNTRSKCIMYGMKNKPRHYQQEWVKNC